MKQLTKELIKQYYDAYYVSNFNGNFKQLNDFKIKYPEESKLLSSMHCKRSIIRRDIDCLQFVAKQYKRKVYFGALTFNNEHIYDKSKRRKVQEHLNECFLAYFIVEEYGALNGRYHVHFVGVFKDNVNMREFHSWLTEKGQGFSEIKTVVSVKKTCQYLCDYLVKQVPRVHRNKVMSEIRKQYCAAKSFENNFPSLYEEKLFDIVIYTSQLIHVPLAERKEKGRMQD